jgi:hypothetical protein
MLKSRHYHLRINHYQLMGNLNLISYGGGGDGLSG